MILSLLTSKAGRYLMAAVAALALLAGAYWWVVAQERQRQKLKELEAEAETTERINDEDADLTDPATALRRLCDLAGITDCPL